MHTLIRILTVLARMLRNSYSGRAFARTDYRWLCIRSVSTTYLAFLEDRVLRDPRTLKLHGRNTEGHCFVRVSKTAPLDAVLFGFCLLRKRTLPPRATNPPQHYACLVTLSQ